VPKPDGGIAKVEITNVTLCPYFRTNLISTSKLEQKGLYLITLNGGYIYPSNDIIRKLFLPVKHKMYWCLEFNPPTHHKYVQDPREGYSHITSGVEGTLTKPQKALKKLLTSTTDKDK
jgi:hypothetical protein